MAADKQGFELKANGSWAERSVGGKLIEFVPGKVYETADPNEIRELEDWDGVKSAERSSAVKGDKS